MALNGIDISAWQADINISKLTTTDFVIVKATGGTSYTNEYLSNHANATLSAGKLLGLYHYARERSCKGTAEAEAKHFYEAAKPYIGKAILILDWEEELSAGESWALAWLNEVKRLTGVTPLFYCYQSALSSYKYSSIANAGYKLWLAQYANNNTTGYKSSPWQSGSIGAFSSYIMHQYSSSGRITGYSSNLDLDLFKGTKADWAALCKTGSTTTESSTTTDVETIEDEVSEVQVYKNGSTKEIVYQSTTCADEIGYLDPYETCKCYAKIDGMYLVSYELGSGYHKTGFVKYSGKTSW